jgi:hypothetical protein
VFRLPKEVGTLVGTSNAWPISLIHQTAVKTAFCRAKNLYRHNATDFRGGYCVFMLSEMKHLV